MATSTTVTSMPAASICSWSGLAAEAGYYDQSHLVAEFRRLMRVTPGAFAAGRVRTTSC
jgi:AraC-like DNA-binding protein